MKAIITFGLIGVAFLSPAKADREFIWGVNGAAGAASNLYAINPANGKLLGRIGGTGTVCLTGLEVKNGVLFAVQGQLSPTGASSKHLYTLDKSTGVASTVATLDSQYPLSDLALRISDGTMFAFAIGGAVKKLASINTSTGAVTPIGAMNNITNVSLTFVGNTLYLVRTNGLFTMNPATGTSITGPFALNGATTQIDNFMATNSAGTIYCGLRTGANTNLYTLDPVTRATTLVGTVSGAALSGIAFDSAAPPTFSVKGGKRVKTDKSRYKFEGNATSLVPLTVSTKGKSTKAAAGKWKLTVKLKPGRNKVKLLCDDGLGQIKQLRVTIVRS